MSVLQCKSLASRLHYGDPGCLIRHKHQHQTKTSSRKDPLPGSQAFPYWSMVLLKRLSRLNDSWGRVDL
ncbi:hypothetical protein QL093DRAFT_2246411 [Fusarium oxysporum]|nr:hypothetical protein QL093DRAFT_2246411 [Fusarium oxysporum]